MSLDTSITLGIIYFSLGTDSYMYLQTEHCFEQGKRDIQTGMRIPNDKKPYNSHE